MDLKAKECDKVKDKGKADRETKKKLSKRKRMKNEADLKAKEEET